MTGLMDNLQAEHTRLLQRLENPDAGLPADVQVYVDKIKAAAADVEDPFERDQLRANLRFWASYLHDETGDYPETSLPESLAALVTDNRLLQLWMRIDALEKAVVEESGSQRQVTADLEMLRDARNKLLSGRNMFEDASILVVRVEAQQRYRIRARQWVTRYSPFLVGYYLVWTVLLMLGIFYLTPALSIEVPVAGLVLQPMLIAAFVAGLGGVCNGLFAIASHARQQDFDPQYLLWYLTIPVMGAVIGIFVDLLALSAIDLLSTGILRSDNFLLYILAFVAGFQQNAALRLMNQLVRRVFAPEEKSDRAD